MKIWFNEHGYVIQGPLGGAKSFFDVPEEVESDASSLYNHRWAVFNEAMRSAVEFINQEDLDKVDLTIYSDCRIIEELRDGLESESKFGKDVKIFFLYIDSKLFDNIIYKKCSSVVIYNRMRSGII